ncbi:MAG: AI-2E family transporter [Rhodoluna sp.]|jgi:predicted PurR-regulated permease PerM
MSKPSLIRVSHAFQIGLLGGLGVLTAVMLGNALLSIASILTSIITALFLALGLEPLIQILEKRVKRRAIAISIVGLGLIGLITMVIVVILPPLISQASEFLTHLPELLKGLVQTPWISDLDARFDGAVSNALTSSGEYLADSKNWPNLLGGVVQVGLSILNGTAAFLTVCILTIYFISSHHAIKNVMVNLVAKSKRERVGHIVDQVVTSVGRYVMGQVSVASINASIMFITLLFAGVEYAVVLAFIDFLLVLVPVVGSISGAIVVIGITAATMPPETTITVAIVVLLYTQLEAYLISPRIMKRAVNVPAALVMVSALAGGALLGILGALLAIPVAATVLLIIREVWVPTQNKR